MVKGLVLVFIFSSLNFIIHPFTPIMGGAKVPPAHQE